MHENEVRFEIVQFRIAEDRVFKILVVFRFEKLRLDVPGPTRIAWELKKKGLPLPDGILTAEELVKEIEKCR